MNLCKIGIDILNTGWLIVRISERHALIPVKRSPEASTLSFVLHIQSGLLMAQWCQAPVLGWLLGPGLAPIVSKEAQLAVKNALGFFLPFRLRAVQSLRCRITTLSPIHCEETKLHDTS